jgi:dTDP-4-amino-4,6-dideoxygalactose transaminase
MSRLALLGGKPLCALPPPKVRFPSFSKKAVSAVVERIESRKQVELGGHPLLESRIREYHGGGHALALSSGTATLQIAMAALGVGPGDEVITSPYSWGATTACILQLGAIPVFTDVERETGLMNPEDIQRLITRRTKAVMVVHIYGQAANMTRISAVARKHNLLVIEDGSQSHGALWKGRKVGRFGDSAGFSCMGGKLLAGTEGGYALFKRRRDYFAALTLSQHPKRSSEPGLPPDYKGYWDSLFYSYRICLLSADLLAEQVLKLDREIETRRQNVAILRKMLSGSQYFSFPRYGKGCEPSYHMVTANFDWEKAGVRTDTFRNAVTAEGFQVFGYVPSPIPTWKRMNWQGYDGPPAPWLRWLKQAKANYRDLRFPQCEWKIAHEVEFGFNYLTVEPRRMQAFADCVLKVEEELNALRDWERKQRQLAG